MPTYHIGLYGQHNKHSRCLSKVCDTRIWNLSKRAPWGKWPGFNQNFRRPVVYGPKSRRSQYGGHYYWTGHPRNFQLITSLVCERQYVWHDKKISNRATQLESGCSKVILMHLAKQPYSIWYQHGLLASSIHHFMATHDFRLAKWRTCGLQKSNVSMINS